MITLKSTLDLGGLWKKSFGGLRLTMAFMTASPAHLVITTAIKAEIVPQGVSNG